MCVCVCVCAQLCAFVCMCVCVCVQCVFEKMRKMLNEVLLYVHAISKSSLYLGCAQYIFCCSYCVCIVHFRLTLGVSTLQINFYIT